MGNKHKGIDGNASNKVLLDMDGIKQRMIDFIKDNSILSVDTVKIIIDFLIIMPLNIKQQWMECEQFTRYNEILGCCKPIFGDDKLKRWVKTQPKRNNAPGDKPTIYIENILAIYYYMSSRDKYVLVGKCKYSKFQSLSISIKCMPPVEGGWRAGDQGKFIEEPSCLGGNPFDPMSYGDEEELYFMTNLTKSPSPGSCMDYEVEGEIIFSSTWNDLYYHGLNTDKLRLECYRNHPFASI